MRDEEQSKEQLLEQLGILRRRLAVLEEAKSERRAAEQLLSRNEAQKQTILDALATNIAFINENLEIIWANRTAARSVNKTPEEMLGRRCHEFWGDPSGPCDGCPTVRAFDSRKTEHAVIRTPDGRTWDEKGAPVFDGEGRLLGVVQIAHDITEHVRTEALLRKYVFLANAAPNLISFVDKNYCYQAVNDAYLHAHQKTRDEIMGHSVGELHGTEVFHEVIKPEIDRCLGGEEIRYAAWFDYPGLGRWFVDVIYHPYRDPDKEREISGIVVSVHDITGRKLAEDSLRENEERLRLAHKASNDVIWDWDVVNDARLWSQAGATVFGWTDSVEHPQTVAWWVHRIHPEDRPRVQEGIFAVLNGPGADRWHDEYRFRRANGSYAWVVDRGYVLRDEQGKAVRMIGAMRDITERKEFEEERLQLEERLQRAEKMEALGTLAGGVAHDLNNVLGIVVGYSELLLHGSDESGSTRATAAEILKGGQRAAAIVQDLLTLARRAVPIRKVLNLNNIVRECRNSAEFAKLLCEHPRVRLRTDLEVDLLNVLGSSLHLEKSFINLVANAAEAMPGGGTVTVKTANSYLDKPISGYDEMREGEYALLSVADTGEGISASDLKRIFEPFYTKKVMGRSGTGLGLAVVWGAVKDHLGYINVESEVGKGTVFTLYFPVSRDELTREQVSAVAADYPGKGETILVVDDVREQRELAGAMLRKLNYRVETASSGEEAVELLRRQKVDLVVLDMLMDPGMDGLDTYMKILEIHPRQPAIIVSGFSETDRVSKAQSLGAGAYVKKPYILETLGLAVRKELDRAPAPLNLESRQPPSDVELPTSTQHTTTDAAGLG